MFAWSFKASQPARETHWMRSVTKDSKSLTIQVLVACWHGVDALDSTRTTYSSTSGRNRPLSIGHLVPWLLMFLGTVPREWTRHFRGSEVPCSLQLQASRIECRAFPQHCEEQLCQVMGSPDHDNIPNVSTHKKPISVLKAVISIVEDSVESGEVPENYIWPPSFLWIRSTQYGYTLSSSSPAGSS